MSSWQARVSSRAVRAVLRRRDWGDEAALVARARRLFGAPAGFRQLVTLGLAPEVVARDGVRGEWLTPSRPRLGAVLYVHGGGFVSCSPGTHRPITAALARYTRRRVFSVDYRLAPEARLPAAHEDVLAAYRFLLASGLEASRIALAGDSAGGNAVLALAVRLRDLGMPMPGCVVAFSPWSDLTGRSPSQHRNDGKCHMFHPEVVAGFASAALGDGDPEDPALSPVYADLRGLPPVLLHVGSTEVLLDDTTRVHARILDAGGASTMHVYDDLPHCWQMAYPLVPEAVHSLREAAAFIEQHA